MVDVQCTNSGQYSGDMSEPDNVNSYLIVIAKQNIYLLLFHLLKNNLYIPNNNNNATPNLYIPKHLPPIVVIK